MAIRGAQDADSITGSDRSDEILGLGGEDRLAGRDGDDRLVVEHLANGMGESTETVARLAGGRGNDQLIGGLNQNLLSGGPGDDIIVSRGRDDRIVTGAERDRVLVGGRYQPVPSEIVVQDLVRGDDRLFIQDRSFAQLDANGDGVLDDKPEGGLNDLGTIGDVTLDGVTRTSTIIALSLRSCSTRRPSPGKAALR